MHTAHAPTAAVANVHGGKDAADRQRRDDLGGFRRVSQVAEETPIELHRAS